MSNMIRKWIACLAVCSMALTMVGCGDTEDSQSEAVSTTEITTTAVEEETTSTEAETTAVNTLNPEELELSEEPDVFGDISLQTPAMWSQASVEGLQLWYPMDGSGSITAQVFDPEASELTATDKKARVEELGRRLADGNTIISEVWNPLNDTEIDAFAITYTPSAEEEIETAEKISLSVLFYVGEDIYAIIFSTYHANSTVLYYVDKVIETITIAK